MVEHGDGDAPRGFKSPVSCGMAGDERVIMAQFVRCGRSGAVHSAMVDGRWIMHDGRVLTMDEAAVVREADRIARRAWVKLFADRPDLPAPPVFAPAP